MTEKLQIHNFGPIKDADIDLRDLTVFVGPHASGKSLAAQSLYFLRRFETLVKYEDSPANSALSALKWWFGRDFTVYTDTDTLLYWNPDESNTETIHEIRWNKQGFELSQSLENKSLTPAFSQKAEIYIPAGRTLYSFLPPYALMSRVIASEEWPGYILTFYELLGRTIQWLNREQETDKKEEHHNEFLEKRIYDIFKGRIHYRPETISLDISKGVLHPMNIASGQMEILPFWAIVEAGIKSKRFESATIYFEEPEAHLHPAAQHKILEIISYLVGKNTRFLITTHSPYILYSINNFLMAQKVLDAGHKLPVNIPGEVALHSSRVAAYRFSSDGKVHDIMNREVGLIDEEELDNVADMLGEDFSLLQDCMEKR